MALRTIVLSFLSLALGAGLFTAATPATNSLPAPTRLAITHVTMIDRDDGSSLQATDAGIRKSPASIVTQIQSADYEGDRAALKRLYQDLAPFDPLIPS